MTPSTTDTILVVLDPDEPTKTVRAAVHRTDTDAVTYHLLRVMSTRTYERKRRAVATAGDSWEYTIGQAAEHARQEALNAGRAILGPDGNDFEACGAVGREPDQIRRLVHEIDASMIYVPDRDESLLQRFLGSGDLAGTLARTLPDRVTVEPVDGVAEDSAGEPGVPTGFEPGVDPTAGTK